MTPVPPGTVVALRQTVGAGNALKWKPSRAIQPQPPALDFIKFHVRVAHARYSGDAPVTLLWYPKSVGTQIRGV